MVRPIITPHAVRRFAELALGVRNLPTNDDDALKALELRGFDTREISAMLSAFLTRAVDLGAVAVTLRGSRYVLRGRRLITVLSTGNRKRRRARIERDGD